MQTKFDSVQINLNGKIYLIDSSFQQLPTRYPRFDTLQILDRSWRKTTKIVCNFKPDTSYSFFMNCCAMLDIAPTSKFRLQSATPDTVIQEETEIQYRLMDRPSITFKIKHGTYKDSIYAWYKDYACFPSFKLINKKGWNYGVPQKCFYWSNISPFVFFKSKTDYSKDMDKNGVIKDIYPEDLTGDIQQVQELATIYTRLFDDEKFVITYDVKKKKIKLEYDH